jgi:transcription antitermination factor NusG
MVMSDRLKVLTIPSTVNLVSFQGAPAVVPDEQIEALANATANRKIEPYEYLGPGNRVRIALGAFAGVEGTIVRKKDRLRFVVSFDWMCRSVALLIDGCDIEQLV